MAPPNSAKEIQQSREDRHAAWKTLNRDSRGRWVKKTSSTGGSKSNTVLVAKPSIPEFDKNKAISQDTDAQNVLNKVQTEFNLSCPRCAGDMVKKNIRCGPERLVAVNKCTVCNFFLPLNS
jgi:hypothetical protein